MGMSLGDLERIKRELGMVEGVEGTAGAIYKIPSAWLREMIHENERLHQLLGTAHLKGGRR